MFLTERHRLKLFPRNEGKIKSYESCHDFRAWSHDNQTRDRYLRDWIKCDMPVCVIPTCTLANFLRTMTWRCRGRGSPRCHPDCKSKVVLDSICSSCHAMKECLRNNENHEKYFDEEEFETAHWPCERCLEALKSIKMMWKLIMEKIFKITIPKTDDFHSSCNSNDSVQTVAKAWQNEIVQQTLIVKNLSPYVSNRLNLGPTNSNTKSNTKTMKKESTLSIVKQEDLIKDSICIKTNTVSNPKHKNTETNGLLLWNTQSAQDWYESSRRKLNRYKSFRFEMTDVGCDACDMHGEELIFYRNDLDYLQQRCNLQNEELKRLKNENLTLRLELQQLFRNKPVSYTPMIISDTNTAVIPKPFETFCDEQDIELARHVDSEIVITLKNCQNEKFRKVSLLQVLHKTNGPLNEDILETSICNKHEDPVKVLTKVHETFGAIVKREIRIATNKQPISDKIHIEASYHKMSSCKSNPSCSKMSSVSSLTDSIFESSTNVV